MDYSTLMVRKEFIKQISVLASGVVLAPAGLKAATQIAGKQCGEWKLKKGIGFGMIKENIALVDKLKLVREIGFDGVEFNAPVDLSLRELLDARDRSGVEIPSVVNRHHWSKPLSDPDESVRQFIIDSVAKSLEEVKALGGDTVLVVPGVVNDKVPYEIAYKNALGSVRQLIPFVEKTGMKIGLENVWNNFLMSPMEAKRFVDEIGHPLVGWYFDAGNVLRYGWPEDWIGVLGSRIVKVHAKDFSREKMNNEGLKKGFDVPLGEGDVNWPLVMDKLRGVNYRGGWLIAELTGGDRNYLKKVSEQLDGILKV